MTWTEAEQGKRWERSDGSAVYEASLYCFNAVDSKGLLLVNSRGAPRSWTTPEAAMAKVDSELRSPSPPSKLEVASETAVTAVPYDDLVTQAEPELKATPTSKKDFDLLELPDDWEPPSFMDCGHLDFHLDDNDVCEACTKKIPPSWRHLQSTFIRPLPIGRRRTKAKEAGIGFPGLCCNAEGLYIGGPFNNCTRDGEDRCEVHA